MFPPRFAGALAMDVKAIVCLLVLGTFLFGAQYGLHQLADSVELSSFLEIGAAIVALEVALAFGWDWLERRR
jgi:hypothetical protein